MYDERRFYSELYTVRREGMDEGMEKGIEKGRAEAIRTMIASGIPAETVTNAFGMPVEECKAL